MALCHCLRIIKQIAAALRNTTGAEIAEAALVLPLVFTLLLGIIWFGRAFNIYSTIQQAAQQGALKAARPSCATSGNTLPPDKAVTAVVEAVMNSSSLDTSQIIATSSTVLFCPSPPYPAGKCTVASDNVTVCSNVQLNAPASSQPPQCGSAVMFQYPFAFNFPGTSLNMHTITMSAQAQSRMEN
jgi:Flp pilus assembly protein TadG